MKNFGAIILAAGKGTRMKAKLVNKVAMHLANKPIILHAIELLHRMHFGTIIIVVGFAKDSVMDALSGKEVIFAEQKIRLGTAHAVKTALDKLPDTINNVLVVQGDDSAFYGESVIKTLLETHEKAHAALTMLTVELDNPYGLGRIIRDNQEKITAVIEEKDATAEQRNIREINPACYVFSVTFLKKYLPFVKKSSVTGEYYLTSLIHIAIENNEKLEAVRGGKMPWRGVNTREELLQAEQLFSQTHS